MNYTTVDIDSISLQQRPSVPQRRVKTIFAIVIRQEFICSFDSVHIESPSEGLLDR